jgi:hypothetical protein
MNYEARSEMNIRERELLLPFNNGSQINNSSILLIKNQDELSMADLGKTCQANIVNKDSLSFWFKRSDFYVTGLNFVLSRIALMCQLTTIPFYLVACCGVIEVEGTTPYQVAVAPAISFISSFIYSLVI